MAKFIELLQVVDNLTMAKEIGLKGVQDFPNEPSILVKLSYICSDSEAREIFTRGYCSFPRCGKLWISLARIEERANNDLKFRYILERVELSARPLKCT